jgi:hypothetical protein
MSAKTVVSDFKPEKYQILRSQRSVLVHKFFVIGSFAPDGKYIIIITAEDFQDAIEDYILP